MSASALQRSLPTTSAGSASPIKRSLQGSSKNDVQLLSALELRQEMADELANHWVGPMPVREFLDTFLPLPSGVAEAPKKPQHFSELPKAVKLEKDLYSPLRKCIESHSLGLISGFQVVDTSERPDKGARTGKKHKPDISIYRAHVNITREVTKMDEQELPWEIKPNEYWDICHDPPETAAGEKDEASENVDDQDEVQEGNHAEEEQPQSDEEEQPQSDEEEQPQSDEEEQPQSDEADAFTPDITDKDDEEDGEDEDDQMEEETLAPHKLPNVDEARLNWPFERRTKKAIDCRGQIASYATELNSRQHRLHSFSILICHPYVRFLRFDRAGIIVSRRFNILKDGQHLVDFLWRFARVTPQMRGRDETVRRANDDETELAKTLLKDYVPPLERPIFVFTIPHQGKDCEFLAWGSFSDADSLIGRATRAYPVVDVETKKICFLKDNWRAECLEPEAEILKRLNAKEVPHVPEWVCGGDIEQHSTRTHEFANNAGSTGSATWALGRNDAIIRRIHHRFVEDCVGVPLRKFECTRDLLRAIYHAAKAHKAAYENCQILHRDISANNILLVRDPSKEEWNGVLIDWDLAKDITNSDPRNHQRTGTWQFISSRLCEDGTKLPTLQDDLESLVLVLIYHAIRYTRHSMIPRSAAMINEVFCHYVRFSDQSVAGGYAKYAMFSRDGILKKGDITFEIIGNQPLNLWITNARRAVGQWIKFKEAEEDKTRQQNTSVDQASLNQLFEDQPVQDLDIQRAFLKDHSKFVTLCQTILDRDDWPSNDAAVDNCRPQEKAQKSKVVPHASTEEFDGCSRPRSRSSQGSSTGKRSREPTGLSNREHQLKKHKLRGD